MNKDTESEQMPDKKSKESDQKDASLPAEIPASGVEPTSEPETEPSPGEPPVAESGGAEQEDGQVADSGAQDSAEQDTAAATSGKKRKSARTTGKKGGSSTSGRSRSTAGSRRLLALLLLLLLLVGGLSWLLYWGWQQYQDLQRETRDIARSQSELRQEVTRLNQRQELSITEREQLEQSVREEQQALENMVVETAQRLSRRQDLEADRWPLEEALTLLRLAERRLQLDRDATIAISLLNAADQILTGLTEAAVLPVRRQIAADRLALQSVSSADVNGAYFRLEAVAERIASREWSPAERLKPREQSDTDLSVNSIRETLSSLVTVTRLEVPHRAPPLLSDFALWQQHSQLLVEQVQLALLAQNQQLFDAALEQLQMRVNGMIPELDLDSVASDLAALEGLVLSPDYPDIHSSVEALEQYMTRVDSEPDASVDDREGDE